MTEESPTKGPTYSVMRSRRLPPGSKHFHEVSIVATGLCWEVAKAECNRLEREEREAKPLQTSWTRDVFYCEREED